MRYLTRMKLPNEILKERIAERLEILGLTERAVSIAVTGKPDLIRFIRTRGTLPSADKIITLAAVLECSTAWLMGKSNDPTPDEAMLPLIVAMKGRVQSREAPQHELDVQEIYDAVRAPGTPKLAEIPFRPRLTDAKKDIPLFASDVGSEIEFSSDGGKVKVRPFLVFADDPIMHAWRPFGLIGKASAYGFFVPVSGMEPAFDAGTPVLIDPVRTPKMWDYALVRLARMSEGQGRPVIMGRVLESSGAYVKLRQYRPEIDFEIPMPEIESVHRVLSLEDVLGL
jgi:hypothetical protein